MNIAENGGHLNYHESTVNLQEISGFLQSWITRTSFLAAQIHQFVNGDLLLFLQRDSYQPHRQLEYYQTVQANIWLSVPSSPAQSATNLNTTTRGVPVE